MMASTLAKIVSSVARPLSANPSRNQLCLRVDAATIASDGTCNDVTSLENAAERAATWPRSWFPRSGATWGCRRRCRHRSLPGVCALCDETGVALILDDVRAGFRLHLGGSWEGLGMRPDLPVAGPAQ